jgi:hypothetical protein
MAQSQPTALGALLVKGMFYEGMTVASASTAGNISPIPNASLLNAVYNRDCNGGARTDTTDTAANILAAIRSGAVAPVAGTCFIWYVRNISGAANTLTIAGGTGVTVTGTATVAQSNIRTFLGVVTNATKSSAAITLYSLGSQAY